MMILLVAWLACGVLVLLGMWQAYQCALSRDEKEYVIPTLGR